MTAGRRSNVVNLQAKAADLAGSALARGMGSA